MTENFAWKRVGKVVGQGIFLKLLNNKERTYDLPKRFYFIGGSSGTTHDRRPRRLAHSFPSAPQCYHADRVPKPPRRGSPYVFLDAHHERVRQAGLVQKAAVLIAVDIDTEGKHTVLGVSVVLSEHEARWRSLLQSLVSRGLCGAWLPAIPMKD